MPVACEAHRCCQACSGCGLRAAVTSRRLGARKLLAQHDLSSIVHAMRLEPALRNVEPDRDDLHRLSLLRSSTAAINDAATGYRQRGRPSHY